METLEVWRRYAPGIRIAVARWADQEPTDHHRLFEFSRPEFGGPLPNGSDLWYSIAP